MQRKKNIQLLVVLSVIIIIISLLPLLKDNQNGLYIDKKLFTLDQQTVITDVILTSDSSSNRLSYTNGVWQVNNLYELDPNMRDVFFSVLSQLEIRREVASSQNDSISSLSKNRGVQVSIYNNQELIKNYWILGDSTAQTSYLTDDQEQSYIVHIPGYRSYVAGIFNVPETDWRSRRVFSALFTNLNTLKVSYINEDIEFRYKDSFFEIVGVHADSTKLISSLENLLFLQTDQFLDSSDTIEYVDNDVLIKNPFVSILVTKLSGAEERINLFETKQESSFYLGITTDKSYCLFNKKQFNNILVKMSDFQ